MAQIDRPCLLFLLFIVWGNHQTTAQALDGSRFYMGRMHEKIHGIAGPYTDTEEPAGAPKIPSRNIPMPCIYILSIAAHKRSYEN